MFNGDSCQSKNREDAYQEYLQFLLDVITGFPNFHVLGHLDGVLRYPGFQDRVITTGEFPQLIDRILIELISTGRGIEVTSSVNYLARGDSRKIILLNF